MRLTFAETMTGSLETPTGRRALEFRVKVEGDSVFDLLGWGSFRLAGEVDLEGMAQGAEVLEGSTLEVGLPFHPYMRYQVFFRGRDGRIVRLFAEKTISVFHPVRSMTTLHGTVHADGELLGAATLLFRLSDLPGFLGSFRLRRLASNRPPQPALKGA